jgi:hypothetical protein
VHERKCFGTRRGAPGVLEWASFRQLRLPQWFSVSQRPPKVLEHNAG